MSGVFFSHAAEGDLTEIYHDISADNESAAERLSCETSFPTRRHCSGCRSGFLQLMYCPQKAMYMSSKLDGIVRCGRWFVVPLLSSAAAAYVWFQPPAPSWVSETVAGGICPIGFTPDNHLVCLESPDNVSAKSALQVREAATGRVVRTHVLGFRVSDNAELTPDGEWALLRQPFSHPVHELLVISVRTGQQRCPPVADESHPRGKMSPDGRYKAVYPHYIADTNAMGEIADLSTGQSLYPADQKVEFSPDNQRWIAIDQSASSPMFVFHALDDGRELGRSPVPKIQGMSRLLLSRWAGDRLEFIAIVPRGGRVQNSRRYSIRVDGTELSDLQPEPQLSDYATEDQGVWWDKGDHWAVRVSADNWAARGIHGWNKWLVLKLLRNPRTRFMAPFHYRWQPVSPSTGEPIGRGVVLFEGDHGFNITMIISPDGHWLAEAGQQIRVWQIPVRDEEAHALWTLFAAAVPWLLFLWRSQPKSVVLSPSLGAGGMV